jgi:hypothetical protein
MDSGDDIPRSVAPTARKACRLALWSALLICAIPAYALAAVSADPAAGSPWWRGQALRDLQGNELNLTGQWYVVIFLGQECPVSNAAIAKLNQLALEFSPRGFVLVGAYVDPTASLATLRRHALEYGITFPVTDDREQRLARLAQATVTPEAVVFSADGAKLYQGRIDDRVGEGGVARPRAVHEDLREVLIALTEGKPGPFPSHPGFGCTLPQAIRP